MKPAKKVKTQELPSLISVSQFTLGSMPSEISTNMVISHRTSELNTFQNDIMRHLEIREQMKVIEKIDGETVDSTPKEIPLLRQVDKFRRLKKRIDMYFFNVNEGRASVGTQSQYSRSPSANRMVIGGMKLSMEDIIYGIGSVHMMQDSESSESGLSDFSLEPFTEHNLPFIKVSLQKTGCYLLYEQCSFTVLKGTDEGNAVEADNKQYEYLTVGKGKIRRRSDIEAQTNDILTNSRLINTNPVETATIGTYVSYFEMYDTYKALRMAKETCYAITPVAKTAVRKLSSYEQFANIIKLPSFKLASMVIKRLLAGNVYQRSQKRFRNMNMPNRMARQVSYQYSVQVLFRFSPQWKNIERKAVADISFCARNGDVFATAYGLYSFSAMHVPNSGLVCIWNIKNPDDPERMYFYKIPVISVEFSPYEPSLLAVGLFDGTIEVHDITNADDPPLAVSKRGSSSGSEPAIAIKWIQQSENADTLEIDPLLSLSQNSAVTKFRIINSPVLMNFQQMTLERVEGIPEGLLAQCSKSIEQQANRNPQGLSLTMHPLYPDIYYILTDEGCIYKCSTNYPNQYLQLLKTHDGSVNCMDFSPWSPKLFLTCGNDWTIRIWLDGIHKPLITLQSHLAPVHCAFWSRQNSTIIVALNRKTLDIWDIKRNILQPSSSNKLDSSFNTMAKFAICGNCIAVGNERGTIMMCALDNMPFPPHFQYDELEKAIYMAIAHFPDLIFELKSIGFFGYPRKESVIPK